MLDGTDSRVLLIVPQGRIAGVERVLMTLVQDMRHVVVACPAGSPLAQALDDLQVETRHFHLPMMGDVGRFGFIRSYGRAITTLWRLCREMEPDVVHAFVTQALKVAVPVALVLRLPLVASVHESIHVSSLFKRTALRWTLRGCTTVVAVSGYIEQRLLALGVRSDRVRVVRNGTKVHEPLPTPASELPFTYTLYGRFTPWKGYALALDAFQRIQSELQGTRLLLVGDAFAAGDVAFRQSLVTRVDADPTTPVEVRPATHDVSTLLAESHVVLVPSIEPDPFPTVVLEAQMAGRPVLVSSLGGAKEAIVDGVTGLVVDPSPELLAKAMIEVRTWTASTARAAHDHAVSTFSETRYRADVQAVWASARARYREAS